jgi:subtilase family serine protease
MKSPRSSMSSRLRRSTLIAASLALAFSPAADAGKMKPHSIRADKAELVADATVTPHFGCELRPYDLSKGLFCYGPGAIRKAYNVDGLIANGTNGTGQTIVIIDAYGSPTLADDLAQFDAVFGLPAPPSLQQIHMPGSPPFDYFDGNQLGWAEETSLDVQWAHAIAPGAKIIVVAAVSNNDFDILDAQNYAINNKLGYIMSESFGESELALQQDGAEGQQILNDNEASYKRASIGKISVLVSSGDDGSAGTDINGVEQPFPVANYPASSPSVTTVGGTNLFFGTSTHADPNGSYQGEVVWNDGFGAGGGGVSKVFAMPGYQEGKLPAATKAALNKHRGYPDVAYNGGVVGGVIVHLGFLDPCCGANGFYIFGGTSAGAPQWAGITALANQMSKKPLGFLNTTLYQIGKRGLLESLMHDVTVGDNSIDGVPGFSAGPDWDLATGWGTPADGIERALGNEPHSN